jgi:Asp/Glu/hydantoin racemase
MPESEVFAGGKNIYGIPLGILMLQSSFPRIPGDVGNASSWPFPVVYRVVEGATPDKVVRSLKDGELLNRFLEAACDLERAGTALITTNCGFLVLFQRQIQDALGVPFISSSLLQVPWLQSFLPKGKRVGVLTIERSSLTPDHLRAAALPSDIPIVGMEEVGGYFVDAILGTSDRLDVPRARAEHESAARLLVERNPEVGAIVLECTNMPPYARAIREATGLPVHDLTTLVAWAVEAHRRREFDGWM